MTTSSWKPVLTGEPAAQAWGVIDEIARELAALPRDKLDQPSLAGGSAGVALFFAYLAGVREDQGHEDTAARLLEWAQESVATHPSPPSLYEGFPGVAWAAEHMSGEPQDSFDEQLATYLSRTPWTAPWDLIAGLSGVVVWALAALPRPGAALCLQHACTRLCELAIAQPDGVTWWTPPAFLPADQRADNPDGYDNFGVAHGSPGAIAALAQAVASGALGDALAARARGVVADAVRHLLASALTTPDDQSRFAGILRPNDKPTPTRLAWCYGDPGLAAALLTAARALGEPTWEAEALATAHRAARRADANHYVLDGGLCHGSAGLGVLFARLAHETGDDPVLAEAARRWFVHTLTIRAPGKGIAGYEAVLRDERQADPGWLMGAAGIGLALLAAVTEVEPVWDQTLAASATPAGRPPR